MTEREVVRTIPVPTSVSAEAQQFLGAGFGMAEGAPSPAVNDLDGWRTLIEASNAGVAAMFDMRTAGKHPTVEVLTVGDVPVRLHRAMRAAGVDAELHVFEAMPHGGFFGAPEDDELAREVARFVRSHLTRWRFRERASATLAAGGRASEAGFTETIGSVRFRP
jgi:hypothetical protein